MGSFPVFLLCLSPCDLLLSSPGIVSVFLHHVVLLQPASTVLSVVRPHCLVSWVGLPLPLPLLASAEIQSFTPTPRLCLAQMWSADSPTSLPLAVAKPDSMRSYPGSPHPVPSPQLHISAIPYGNFPSFHPRRCPLLCLLCSFPWTAWGHWRKVQKAITSQLDFPP